MLTNSLRRWKKCMFFVIHITIMSFVGQVLVGYTYIIIIKRLTITSSRNWLDHNCVDGALFKGRNGGVEWYKSLGEGGKERGSNPT